jgi:hypothetical protein
VENPNEFRADLIEISVSGVVKTEHVFHAADGVLGVLNLNGMISKGEFRGADGSELTLEKTNFWKSEYQLFDGGEILATANSPKVFKRAYEIKYEGQSMRLEPRGSKLRSWTVLDADHHRICEIKPRGAFKRGAVIHLFSPAALGLLALAYTLVSKRWQEENSAAAA